MPSIRVFSIKSIFCIRWPKYWSFSFSISPSNDYSGLISFRIDWFELLAVQGTLKSLLQHHSSKASVLRCSAFFIVSVSLLYTLTTCVLCVCVCVCVCMYVSEPHFSFAHIWMGESHGTDRMTGFSSLTWKMGRGKFGGMRHMEAWRHSFVVGTTGGRGFPGGTRGKEPTCQCRRCKRCRFDPWVRKIPWRRAWHPTPVFLPGESHGQRGLVGCGL